jgi:hypothetical protein
MACRNGRPCLRSLGLLAFLALACAGCESSGTPEDEIRTFVEKAEVAAEARDASELKGLVADDYEDASGRDAADVRNLLHTFLVAHPSLALITRIDSIDLEGTGLARFQVTVGVLGREASAESNWDLAAEVRRLDIRLAREDSGEWRVIRAGPQADP